MKGGTFLGRVAIATAMLLIASTLNAQGFLRHMPAVDAYGSVSWRDSDTGHGIANSDEITAIFKGRFLTEVQNTTVTIASQAPATLGCVVSVHRSKGALIAVWQMLISEKVRVPRLQTDMWVTVIQREGARVISQATASQDFQQMAVDCVKSFDDLWSLANPRVRGDG